MMRHLNIFLQTFCFKQSENMFWGTTLQIPVTAKALNAGLLHAGERRKALLPGDGGAHQAPDRRHHRRHPQQHRPQRGAGGPARQGEPFRRRGERRERLRA